MGSSHSLKKDSKSSLESHYLTSLLNNSNNIGFLTVAGCYALIFFGLRGTSKLAAEVSKNKNEVSFEATRINKDDKVHSVRIKECWLGNGGLTAFASVLSSLFTFTLLKHHWVEIKVSANKWYTLQLYKTIF